MAGIAAFGAYVPRYRLGGDTAGWNSKSERSIANFDEDSVTMGVAAGLDCLQGADRQSVDGIIFATTTPPYAEKQCAAIIANALDLRRDIFSADITGVLRAGTAGIKAALDSVSAGTAGQVLVIASDNRQGAPKGDAERNSGDGACAFLISRDGIIATLEGFYSITDNMLDTWRSPQDLFVRSWEDRFATEEGLGRVLGETVSGFFYQEGLSPRDVSKVALYAPDRRRHGQLAGQLGFSAEQVQDPLFGQMGNTGAAFPLMLLAKALEQAEGGQLLLVVSYGDGSDVIGFRTAGDVAESRPPMGVTGYLDSKLVLGDYETYAGWRNVWVTDSDTRRPPSSSPSATAMWRENDQNIRLYGTTCNRCGYVQYPPQRVCVNCLARDDSFPVRLSDQPAKVFTYSMDYLAASVDTPLVIAVVDFQGGGRMLCMMTDRALDEVGIGMAVEMSFRKLRVINGIHNYYWKAIPQRSERGN